MTTEQIEAVRKIKKLLRMKHGGTMDEIATALRLAQELAAKHGIDLKKVNPDEADERPINDHDQLLGARIQWECKYAAMICRNYFEVSFVLRSRFGRFAITFIGTDWDIQIALYVYHFLVGHFRREWNTKRGRCRHRQTFMYGMFLGLSAKLRERETTPVDQAALVRVSQSLARREQYLDKLCPDRKQTSGQPDSTANAAFVKGFIAGQQTNIRPAVATAPKTTLQLNA